MFPALVFVIVFGCVGMLSTTPPANGVGFREEVENPGVEKGAYRITPPPPFFNYYVIDSAKLL